MPRVDAVPRFTDAMPVFKGLRRSASNLATCPRELLIDAAFLIIRCWLFIALLCCHPVPNGCTKQTFEHRHDISESWNSIHSWHLQYLDPETSFALDFSLQLATCSFTRPSMVTWQHMQLKLAWQLYWLFFAHSNDSHLGQPAQIAI